MSQTDVFEFPCVFPLKVVGRNDDAFEAEMVAVVRRHAPQSAINTSQKLSGGGKYLSVTVTFVAESREQLDGIYQDLGENSDVLMAL